jgi:hypothetical protein
MNGRRHRLTEEWVGQKRQDSLTDEKSKSPPNLHISLICCPPLPLPFTRSDSSLS